MHKTRLQISSEGTSRVCVRSLTFGQCVSCLKYMCVLIIIVDSWIIHYIHSYYFFVIHWQEIIRCHQRIIIWIIHLLVHSLMLFFNCPFIYIDSSMHTFIFSITNSYIYIYLNLWYIVHIWYNENDIVIELIMKLWIDI